MSDAAHRGVERALDVRVPRMFLLRRARFRDRFDIVFVDRLAVLRAVRNHVAAVIEIADEAPSGIVRRGRDADHRLIERAADRAIPYALIERLARAPHGVDIEFRQHGAARGRMRDERFARSKVLGDARTGLAAGGFDFAFVFLRVGGGPRGAVVRPVRGAFRCRGCAHSGLLVSGRSMGCGRTCCRPRARMIAMATIGAWRACSTKAPRTAYYAFMCRQSAPSVA